MTRRLFRQANATSGVDKCEGYAKVLVGIMIEQAYESHTRPWPHPIRNSAFGAYQIQPMKTRCSGHNSLTARFTPQVPSSE